MSGEHPITSFLVAGGARAVPTRSVAEGPHATHWMMLRLARGRSGECLSTIYVNNYTVGSANVEISDFQHLRWRCSEGHEWHATLANVKDGRTWCPECSTFYKTESEIQAPKGPSGRRPCRCFENLTRKKTPKARPAFLHGLELDGYCEELGVAFEYNGRQHYEFVPFFHRNGPEDLEAQQWRDYETEILCQEEGIALVTLRYDDPDV